MSINDKHDLDKLKKIIEPDSIRRIVSVLAPVAKVDVIASRRNSWLAPVGAELQSHEDTGLSARWRISPPAGGEALGGKWRAERRWGGGRIVQREVS